MNKIIKQYKQNKKDYHIIIFIESTIIIGSFIYLAIFSHPNLL
jgi:hypothetical protein